MTGWSQQRYLGVGDLPGQVNQVDDTDNLDDFMQHRKQLEQGAEAETDQRQHHRETDTDSKQVRNSAAHAEIQSGCRQHDVIGARRYRGDDGENNE